MATKMLVILRRPNNKDFVKTLGLNPFGPSTSHVVVLTGVIMLLLGDPCAKPNLLIHR